MTELEWMHPSYRDLVIDELASHKSLRDTFLRTANIRDIGLAFSTQGGATGKRTMPLIVDDESKRIIEQRIQDLLSELDQFDQNSLLSIIDNSAKENNPQKDWIVSLLDESLKSIRKNWQGKSIDLRLLENICKLTLHLKPLAQLPDFEPTWNYQINLLKKVIVGDGFFSGSEVGNWAKLISLLRKNEPRFLTQVNFPDAYISLISEIIKNLESDVNSYILSPTTDEIRYEIDRIIEIIDGLNDLSSVENSFQNTISSIEYSLQQKRYELTESVKEDQEPDFEDIDDEPIDHSGFDIDQLFSDL